MAPSSRRWTLPLFFLWILLIHTAGLYLFTKGFLLTRQILDSKSDCSNPPVNLSRISLTTGTANSTCWTTPVFSKAIILLIDALRHDFTTSQPTSLKPYHNALTILHEAAAERPHNALLLPFIADPPTTTLQRLKALTTGTLPTFIEAGSNFAGSAIKEDNLITQLRDAGKTLVHLGDDTWSKLFPDHFDPRLSHPYDSFLVEDLHTVDDGIYKHLFPLLRNKTETWDVIVAHFLGVDHVGHRFGPSHPEMRGKLHQMDDIVREAMREVDDETVLIVMGDHGMDENGNHGGETSDEVRAALWLYTAREVWGVVYSDAEPITGVTRRDTPQVDVVATLALLMGVPIPFNNLGQPIEEAFAGVEGGDWARLVEVNALAAAQMQRFAREYEKYGGEGLGLVEGEIWSEVEVDFGDEVALRELYGRMREYQSRMLEGYRRIWAQFNPLNMVEGVVVLLLGAVALLCFQVDADCAGILRMSAVVAGIVTGVVAGAGHVALAGSFRGSAIDGVTLGTAMGSAVLYIWQVDFRKGFRLKIWDWQAVIFTLLLSIGFASNSYTVWEDRVVLVFLSTFGLSTFGVSSRLRHSRGMHGARSLLFMLLSRVASLSRACREEQLPFCRTSFYRLENSAVWRLSIPVIIAVAVLYTTRMALQGLDVRKVFWFRTCMPAALLFNAVFWTLESANEQGWLVNIFAEDTSKTVRMTVARIVLVIVLVGLATAFTSTSGQRSEKQLIFTTAVLLASILASKPTGGLSMTILYYQLISLRHLVPSKISIKPTIAALLGTLHFFSTGHNATFSSIQWKTAYIPFRDPQYPWSPLLVIVNTFAAPIVAACAVPLHSRDDQSQARLLAVQSTVYTTWAVFTALWACILRRHLMLFAVFCPRFLMAGGLMVIIDGLALLSSY
ncbi:alkaline phosphatase-like protein [Aspergillus sclerotioniger CBS 115572]|uniref:Alkaline phosphatase-like protein n=1 Tax=Aspergillus sclerotioniger CBS 115572 TaxID=1450535 RepID=A0A317X467_9EURO|nr:alkaline phosphatase-like protein [Aspergillus sclerotioniger CBS 115572]PWY93373.1 alkaline phosphatase-like protein [Aspergillus sclerotioniger CBS 115572]